MARKCSRGGRLPAFGVIAWCGVWFPWMRPEHTPSVVHMLYRGRLTEGPYASSLTRISSLETFTPESSSDETVSWAEI
jgi:hypothetical protein